jgi:hypothetical protein
MHLSFVLAAILLVALVVGGVRKRPPGPPRPPNPLRQLQQTGRRLYTRRNFLKLVAGTGGAALLAWSGADEAVDEWHRTQVRSANSDALAQVAKGFGESEMAFAALAFGLADWGLPGTAIGRWGRQCFTATACGLPVLWSWQRMLGGSRPSDEKPWGPRFRPFADENSVSGHTFLAAIPFLVAAREVDHAWLGWGLRILSPLTGWSRLNDGRHYLSQVLLGYALAVEATRAAALTPDDAPVKSSPASGRNPD